MKINEHFDISGYIDHTVLRPTATEDDIKRICKEAIDHKFAAVCVPPVYTKLAKKTLSSSNVNICTVISFPFGYQHTEIKIAETLKAMKQGANELDVVINMGLVKSKRFKKLKKEIESLSKIIHEEPCILKLIIETANLERDEMMLICDIAVDAEVDYIKTSTGYAEKGAVLDDIIFLRKYLPDEMKIKASGGIKTYADAFSFINNGADRIGTSSGVDIIKIP